MQLRDSSACFLTYRAFAAVTFLLLVAIASAETLMVSNGGYQVAKINSAGAATYFYGFGYSVEGLVFDTSGNLYVEDSGYEGDGEITKITPAGTATTFASGFFEANGLAFDGSGNLYTADYYGNVLKTQASHRLRSGFISS